MIRPLGDRVLIEANRERRDDCKRDRIAGQCERKAARR